MNEVDVKIAVLSAASFIKKVCQSHCDCVGCPLYTENHVFGCGLKPYWGHSPEDWNLDCYER